MARREPRGTRAEGPEVNLRREERELAARRATAGESAGDSEGPLR